jgi:hypothetical protein
LKKGFIELNKNKRTTSKIKMITLKKNETGKYHCTIIPKINGTNKRRNGASFHAGTGLINIVKRYEKLKFYIKNYHLPDFQYKKPFIFYSNFFDSIRYFTPYFYGILPRKKTVFFSILHSNTLKQYDL